jgi:protoheme IX farnesyltransferase
MVVAAGLLGGATVLTELEWWVRLVHLAIAEIVVAAMAFALVAGFRLGRKRPRVERHLQTDRRLNYLVIASIIGVFLVILSGSFMVGYGAGTSCATWPLCRGELLPQGPPFAVHMGHRLLAAVVGLVVIATVVAAMRKRSERPGVARVGHYVGIAFVLQIVLGAALVWSVFSPEMKSLHLSAATLVWLTVVLLAAVLFTPPYFEAEQEARRPMKTVSGLKRITS